MSPLGGCVNVFGYQRIFSRYLFILNKQQEEAYGEK